MKKDMKRGRNRFQLDRQNDIGSTTKICVFGVFIVGVVIKMDLFIIVIVIRLMRAVWRTFIATPRLLVVLFWLRVFLVRFPTTSGEVTLGRTSVPWVFGGIIGSPLGPTQWPSSQWSPPIGLPPSDTVAKTSFDANSTIGGGKRWTGWFTLLLQNGQEAIATVSFNGWGWEIRYIWYRIGLDPGQPAPSCWRWTCPIKTDWSGIVISFITEYRAMPTFLFIW